MRKWKKKISILVTTWKEKISAVFGEAPDVKLTMSGTQLTGLGTPLPEK